MSGISKNIVRRKYLSTPSKLSGQSGVSNMLSTLRVFRHGVSHGDAGPTRFFGVLLLCGEDVVFTFHARLSGSRDCSDLVIGDYIHFMFPFTGWPSCRI